MNESALFNSCQLSGDTPTYRWLWPFTRTWSIYPHILLSDAHQKVKTKAESYGIPTLDLLPYFQGKNEKDFKATPFDAHPNAKAHAIAARAIFDYLNSNRFFIGNRAR